MIRRRTLLAGAPLAAITAAASSSHSLEQAGQAPGVESLLEDLVGSARLPCAALRVSRNGHTLVHSIHGHRDLESQLPAELDTIYHIYSMTKPVVAAGLLTLRDAGHVTLDDPVADCVPEFSDLQVLQHDGTTAPARPMTIRHLLTHTSGLGTSFDPRSRVARYYREAGLIGGSWYHDPDIRGLTGMAQRLADIPLAFQPGERWLYSMGLDVAGLICERISGQDLAVFLRERLFDPLGMADTGFHVPPDAAARLASVYGPHEDGLSKVIDARASPWLREPASPSGGGGLVSTLEDYHRFARMLASGGSPVLSRESLRLMLTNQLSAAQSRGLEAAAAFGFGGSGAGLGFGLGGAVLVSPQAADTEGRAGEFGWGGAASTTFWVEPQRGDAVVFMSQLLPANTIPVRDLLKRRLARDGVV